MKIILLNNKIRSLPNAIDHVKKWRLEDLIKHLLLEALKAERVNIIWSAYVEQNDWIRKRRYDSWRHIGPCPDLAQPDPKYSIGFDVFSRARRKCAG